jgi:RNA polymerase sigma factor (sigma-70 family)
MDEVLGRKWAMANQDQQISDTVHRHQARLRNFIRKSVPDPGDAEDILQEVFCELVEAYRMMKPIEQVTAWLFRVARNRIIDLFRKRQREPQRADPARGTSEDAAELSLDFLPSRDAGPEAAYARRVLFEELADALAELPDEQREVFVAHELMGRSFKELATESGVSVNTLLSRKHYAVLHLRRRLQDIYDEFPETGD